MTAGRMALGLAAVAMAVAVTTTSLAINEGARLQARRDAEKLGLDTIVLRAPDRRLAIDDTRWIAALRPVVRAVSPVARASFRTHDVLAVGASFAQIRPIAVAEGRFLRAADEDTGERVCVLGAEVARELFGPARGLGQRIRIGRDWFVVVGVAAEHTAVDDEILVPLSALTPRTAGAAPGQGVTDIWIAAAPGALTAAEGRLRDAIAARPRLAGVEVIVARNLLRARDRTQRMFTRVTGLVGALLFALGGLAIANVMLMSVLERRSEIGVRRAVGATRRRIIVQFLREAAGLSLAGAAAGALCGLALSSLTARIAGWPAAFGSIAVIAVPAGAIVIGIVAGLYPAIVASRMTPIEALIHE